MFHIIERREIAHKVFLDGWQHFHTHSIRYFHNQRQRTLSPAFDRNVVIRFDSAPHERQFSENDSFVNAIESFDGRFIPAAAVEQDGDNHWRWTVWLHSEDNPYADGEAYSRREAVEWADRALGKVLGYGVHDQPPIPWELTDRILELEAALSRVVPTLDNVHMRISSDAAEHIKKVMGERKSFPELKSLVEDAGVAS